MAEASKRKINLPKIWNLLKREKIKLCQLGNERIQWCHLSFTIIQLLLSKSFCINHLFCFRTFLNSLAKQLKWECIKYILQSSIKPWCIDSFMATITTQAIVTLFVSCNTKVLSTLLIKCLMTMKVSAFILKWLKLELLSHLCTKMGSKAKRNKGTMKEIALSTKLASTSPALETNTSWKKWLN